MKNLNILAFLLFFAMAGCQHRDRHEPVRDYPIHPVPFTEVKVNDGFWAPKIRTNHEVTIPIAFRKSEETGRIDNFIIAGGLKEGHFCSLYPFDDSDVYKNIEAASYSVQLFPDPELERYLDKLISRIASAQEEDGYLYTNRTIDPDSTHEMAGTERWVNEELHSHELYNVGHLYEAAVAHYQATGKRDLLDVAIKNADLIYNTFGWGKLEKTPGHQEIEIGLVKLYRLLGDERYLELAKFFLDRRGPGGDEYNQMHQRPAEQRVAVGHAVRAQYMYSAMADIAALTGDTSYLQAVDALWADVTGSKTYLTGGIGAEGGHEGFGEPYDLPNAEAYCETCAAIANAFWNYRMFLLHGDSRYFDVLERVVYNGLISGVSLRGDSFFYPNPLESHGNYARKAWFGCACCPVNITRFLPSLPGYIYATKGDSVYVNLYIGNEGRILTDAGEFLLEMRTDYPWNGRVEINLKKSNGKAATFLLRVPGWARNEVFPTDLYRFTSHSDETAKILLNDVEIPMDIRQGYAMIRREWISGDRLVLELPEEIREVRAHPMVKADSGLVAIQSGPLVYCAEESDQGRANLDQIYLEDISRLKYMEDLAEPGNIRPIEGQAAYIDDVSGLVMRANVQFRAIPYYAWANRGKSRMKVWFPESFVKQAE
jgi:DUF1680 family protein